MTFISISFKLCPKLQITRPFIPVKFILLISCLLFWRIWFLSYRKWIFPNFRFFFFLKYLQSEVKKKILCYWTQKSEKPILYFQYLRSKNQKYKNLVKIKSSRIPINLKFSNLIFFTLHAFTDCSLFKNILTHFGKPKLLKKP